MTDKAFRGLLSIPEAKLRLWWDAPLLVSMAICSNCRHIGNELQWSDCPKCGNAWRTQMTDTQKTPKQTLKERLKATLAKLGAGANKAAGEAFDARK